MNVYIYPRFDGEDTGDGGVRRVVDNQRKHFPRAGVTVVDDPGDADVLAFHITATETLIKRFPDKPIVAHCHGLYWSEYQWEEWSYKANTEVLKLICTADVTTAPSEWVADVIRRHTSRDVRVVPHGVDLREWQAATAPKDYVVWNKTRPDPICDPEPMNQLARLMPQQQFVSTFGEKAANVEITGKLNYEAGKQLVRHAGVYLATVRETFGIGTLEAMASQVPVVGYRFGAQPEIITHGVDGWLVEPGDIDGLAEGVRWALANRDVIGKAARERARSYTWPEAAKMYKDVYNVAIGLHSRQQPRVSIIVTAYNLERYLPAALDSVRDQTDSSWECIVVDDASPDSCGAIAKSYAAKDARFKVIHNIENLYLAESRNVAIDAAKGRYILPLDADDKLTPTAVESLADALDVDRTVAVAYGNVLFVDEDGVTPTDYRVRGETPGHSGWPVPFEPGKQASGFNLLPYSSMYRREAWRNVGGYRRRLKTAEDADFWTRLTSFGFRAQMVTKGDTLVYRNRPNSMSRVMEGERDRYRRSYPWMKDEKLAPAPLQGPRAVTLYTPRVSVIIPVGPTHERYVQDAVDSVMSQSYRNWECIVVNDTGTKLKRLPTWVRVFESDARDAGASRNIGIAQARSTLFLPLDADDFLQPDALQWLLTAHTETEGAIIYPDFYEDPQKDGEWAHYRLPDWSCQDLTARGAIHSVTALTPVEVWRKVGGYAEHINWEDWDFQMRCAAAGYCTTRLAAPLFNYRKWTGTRRDYDAASFEERKAIMLERWGEYFRGEKTFMACSCNKTATIAPQAQSRANGVASARSLSQKPNEEAVLVEYVGNKAGSVAYRGASGAIYSFAAGDPPKYVFAQDVQVFLQKGPNFRVYVDDAPVR